MKPSGIGGQAVIEGVMMKNGAEYAVAVRKPDKEIVVEKRRTSEASKKYPILKLPIIRGVAAFAESLTIGMKILTFSASFYEEEEEKSGMEEKLNKMTKGNGEKVLNALTILCSVVLAIGLFVALPMLLAGFLSAKIESELVLALLEGTFRVLLFVGYIFLISQIKDIKRLFMYHGAEHKSINCIENGLPLTVANVRKQSKEHKRCGTSFMLNVMLISVIFFIFIRVDNTLLRFVVRLLLIPVIAGVSYEFIRFAGRSESKAANILSRPGMWMQGLTTREPDDDMIEVAIQSVEAVFDWQSFIEKSSKKSSKGNSKNAKKSKGTNRRTDVRKKLEEERTPAKAAAETVKTPEKAEKAAKTAQAETKEQMAAAKETSEPVKPLEVDLSQLFDIKVSEDIAPVKHGIRPKKDPLPEATKAVSKASSDEDDDILKALDMYFEFDGPKSVMEISDEEK